MPEIELRPDVKAAVEKVVQDELGRFGVREIEVRPGEDHDGDPSIRIIVHYANVDADPDPKRMSDTMFKVNDCLYAMNEKRFAYVTHVVPEPPKRARIR